MVRGVPFMCIRITGPSKSAAIFAMAVVNIAALYVLMPIRVT